MYIDLNDAVESADAKLLRLIKGFCGTHIRKERRMHRERQVGDVFDSFFARFSRHVTTFCRSFVRISAVCRFWAALKP